MQAQAVAGDEAVVASARWEDIDSELSCSTREVCIGYSSLLPVDALAVLVDFARQRGTGAAGWRAHRVPPAV